MTEATAPRRPARRVALAALLGTPLLLGAALGGGVAAYQAANHDRVLPGVSAFGQPLAGLTRTQAAERVAPAVAALLDRPLQVRADDRIWDTTARALGLRLSADAVAEDALAIGRRGDLVAQLAEQLDVAQTGRALDVAAAGDAAALDRALADFARQVDRPAQDAWLALDADGRVTHGQAATGAALDHVASRASLATALANGDPRADLVVRTLQPATTDIMVQPAREQLERALGPADRPGRRLALTFVGDRWELGRADLATLLRLEDGRTPGAAPRVVLNDALLRDFALHVASEIDREGQDARLDWNGGKLSVLRPSRTSHELDQAAAREAIAAALLGGTAETVTLPVAVTEPAVSSANPAALGIVELIDQGSTSFAGAQPEKRHNIALAAERLNGVVVPPGGTFSFNKEVGPTTLEAGFTWGFGITSGQDGAKTVPSVAGGICQVATTLFQPVFWSGYQLEERSWHLYWIPAYTSRNVVGLDVTVDADANLDFRWTNPTDSYVLVRSWVQGDTVNFALYGKKPGWTVRVDPAEVANRVAPDPTPIRQEEPTLAAGRTIQVESAREGFDVTVRRTVAVPGAEPRMLTLRSKYQPSHNVTLVGTGGEPVAARPATAGH